MILPVLHSSVDDFIFADYTRIDISYSVLL